MSWSKSLGPISAGDLPDVLNAVGIDDLGYVVAPEVAAETYEQLQAAKLAALALAGDGAVGDASKAFTVVLTGHANPGHQPTVGWANDCISVSVTQTTAPA